MMMTFFVNFSFDLTSRDSSLQAIRDSRPTAHLFDWFNANHLKLNPDKSEVLFCPSHACPVPSSVFIGDSLVSPSPSPCVRYLGVTSPMDIKSSKSAHFRIVLPLICLAGQK